MQGEPIDPGSTLWLSECSLHIEMFVSLNLKKIVRR